MAAGAAIMFRVKVKLAANLLGIALFTWLVVLHIPRAVASQRKENAKLAKERLVNPKQDAESERKVDEASANEWTSACEALGFSGIAFLIAGTYKPKETQAVSI